MASGVIGVSTNNQYITGKVNWSSVTNYTENYSDVYIEFIAWRTNTGYTTQGNANFTVSIDGQGFGSGGANKTISYNSNTSMMTASKRIYHNNDGSKQIYIGISGALSGSSWSSTSGGATVSLDNIPRASQPSLSATAFDMGSNITIYTNRLASFTHNIYCVFGSTTITVATGVTDSTTFSFPIASLAGQIPNATSGYGIIYCDTYNGGSMIGTKSVGFTANLPSSVVPSISSITHAETATLNGYGGAVVGVYLQNLSSIKFTINGAAGAYGSSISRYEIDFNGTTYSGSTATIAAVNKSGSITATARVYDSRGRAATKSVAVNLVAYANPYISNLTIARCNSDGTLNSMGTYAKVTTAGSISSIINSTQRNQLTYTIYSRAKGASTWNTSKAATALALGTLSLNTSNVVGAGGYAATSSYEFRLDIKDMFNTTISLETLSTGQVTMSWNKNGVGIGKVWEQGALDVAGSIYEDGNALSSKYMGTIYKNSFYGLTSPAGESQWIRTTVNGIIPYQSGSASNLGTSSWRFATGYIDDLVSNKLTSATLNLNNATEWATLITFNTERPWAFKQISTGANTGLILQSTNNSKSFYIGSSTNGANTLEVRVDSAYTGQFVTINGSLNLNSGTLNLTPVSGQWYKVYGSNSLHFNINTHYSGRPLPDGDNRYSVGEWGWAWNAMMSFAFSQASEREKKFEINPVDTLYSYSIIKDLQPYMYRHIPNVLEDDTEECKADLETKAKREFYMGLMVDQAPIEIINQDSEKTINLYSYTTMLLGALKETIKKVEVLEAKIQQLEGSI